MTKTGIVWFLVYYMNDGKSRRYFCDGSGAWRNAERCGVYTFKKVKDNGEFAETVECTQGHQQNIPKGYSNIRHQVEGGLF